MGLLILALVVFGTITRAQTPAGHVDLGALMLVEAWDLNDGREDLIGTTIGADHRVWRGLSIRAEGTLLSVAQRWDARWLGGLTVGTRIRWARPFGRPFVDVAVGLSQASAPVPSRGTSFNFLAVSGGGVEIPLGAVTLDLGMRWFHISNNGREGRQRNPDIQSLGPAIAVGWSYGQPKRRATPSVQ